ncbi:MAG: FAD:protein FMN transferase [Bacteroidales bacterium]|nr:FAD:protein FMN transferase [Bacteroidales bacterium]
MNRFSLLLLVFLAACTFQKETQPVKIQGEAQGTYYSITYFDSTNRDFQIEIDSILDAFDQSVSLWVPNSVLSRVNQNDSTVVLDDYFQRNFRLSVEVAEATEGAFDFTVAPLVKAWGFGFDGNRKVDQHIIDSLLPLVGFRNVKIQQAEVVKNDPRITFDFNAIAQGFSVDVVGAWLESKNINNYLVDIGGEVKAKGKKPDGSLWKVGVEKPAKNKNDERVLKAVVALQNNSIATSGSYRKFYEENGVRYSHTIDPQTGYPVQHTLLSVSVLANNTGLADAYATAFMVWGFEKSKTFVERKPGLNAFFIYSDSSGNYRTYATEGFREVITKEFE